MRTRTEILSECKRAAEALAKGDACYPDADLSMQAHTLGVLLDIRDLLTPTDEEADTRSMGEQAGESPSASVSGVPVVVGEPGRDPRLDEKPSSTTTRSYGLQPEDRPKLPDGSFERTPEPPKPPPCTVCAGQKWVLDGHHEVDCGHCDGSGVEPDEMPGEPGA